MPQPDNFIDIDILPLQRGYINYARSKELTGSSVAYVTKMKNDFCRLHQPDTLEADGNQEQVV